MESERVAKLLPKVLHPLKINIEPENGELEDDFPFSRAYSQVPS